MNLPFSRWFYCKRLHFVDISAADVYNFARDNREICWGYFAADDGFSVYLSSRCARLLSQSPDFCGKIRGVCSCGLFPWLLRHRTRVGLAVGALFSVLFFLCTFGLVWEVRVEGNYQYSDAYLKETFAAHGLSSGTHIASFDRSAFSAEYLRTQEELSYLSVNFRGSVAYVQVLERFATPKESQKTGAANLIARTDGVIRSLSVKTGDPLVHAGSVVRAGDPLVSGVQQGAGGDFFVYAEGEVIARVSHTLTLKIPKNQLRKTREKGALVGFTLKFFEKEINIRLGASNSGSIYDTIYKNKSFYVTDTCRLPFSLGFSYAAIEREQTISLSDAQTASYASRCMDAKLAVFLQDKELLSKRVYGAFEGEYYVITCEIECLENIAVTQEFTVD